MASTATMHPWPPDIQNCQSLLSKSSDAQQARRICQRNKPSFAGSGWRNCSRPECGKQTVSPNPTELGRVDVTGRAAHITAAQDGGPRYDASLTSERRRSAENGIWLCADCADKIDKNAGKGFSVEQIRSWKQHAEARQSATAMLRSRMRRPGWLDKLSTPHYANVPRLIHLVGERAFSRQTLDALKSGFPDNRAIIEELVEVNNVLRQLSISSIEVEEIDKPIEILTEGLPISYFRNCRTKNGGSTDPKNVRQFSFEKSPLIYFDCKGYRYIQPYDPIWLTTRVQTH